MSVVSVHVAILKVLSTYPDGLAAPAALNADLAVLSGSVDWTSRMRSYAARMPGLDIFTQGLVVRDGRGWQITAAGRAVLDELEGRYPANAQLAERERDHQPAAGSTPLEPDQHQLELAAVTQPRPQLTVIQGGRVQLRKDLAAGKGSLPKGAALRP
ncbi:hypothetical protein [Rhodopseudomonas palustris]|uniref:Uncharacterized protein n=1 Tax=Rhodopseudomonas palustris TaxID=1076 RepID=A0A418VNS2_RHOPL|nr:hypothetical protein [Rhodopseudomonas palustris]RJF77846.1 hypothetical protein D4Q52_02795 [Rhodopseudomonas palustris]